MEYEFEEIEEELIGMDTILRIKELREVFPDLTEPFNNIELMYIWEYYSNLLCAGWIYPKSSCSNCDGAERRKEIEEIFAKFSFYLKKNPDDD